MKSSVDVLMSDTLGGNVIHLCKLYGLHKATGDTFTLHRTTMLPSEWVDEPLSDIISTLDFVEYGEYRPDLWDEYIDIVTTERPAAPLEVRKAFNERNGFKFCGTRKDLIKEAYPEYEGCISYLPSNLDPINIGTDAVVIQPWAGKCPDTGPHGYTSLFSIKAIDKMCEYLKENSHPVYIVGKPNKWFYDDDAFDNLEEKYGITNLVGKTESILQALQYVMGAGYMVGFDGVFTFFAGTQQKKMINLSPLNPCSSTRAATTKGNFLPALSWHGCQSPIKTC